MVTLPQRIKHRGFTIVELLIVIVVIAILAAITIVAYNGIQKRALTAQYASAADSISKVIASQMVVDQSVFGDESVIVCAAKKADLPAADGFEEGECLNSSDGFMQAYADDEYYERIFGGVDVSFRPSVLSTQHFSIESDAVNQRAIAMLIEGNFTPKRVMLSWLSADMSSCGGGVGLIDTEALQQMLDGQTPLPDGYTLEQYRALSEGPNICSMIIKY